MGLITDIFNYTANNLSICMDFPANMRANRVAWRAESVRGEKQGRHVKVRILLMRDGPLNNWMGRAVSTVEAEAFKALAIVKKNPPSTLCSMAVIYARASKRVPYGSQDWMHKAMSGLAKHTLESAAKRASHSSGWSDSSGRAIIMQLCIFKYTDKGGSA